MTRDRRRLHAWLLIAVTAALLGGASVPDRNRAPSRASVSEGAEAGPRTDAAAPNRFGVPASRRWRVGRPFVRENLAPVPNPDVAAVPPHRRDRPFDVVLSRDGSKVYVGLQGSELQPGSEIAVYDVATDRVTRRILLSCAAGQPPASSVFRLAIHPEGRFLFVTSRFSNFASIVDTRTDTVISEVPLDFYAQGVAFDRDGTRAFVANRYLDQVLVVDVRTNGGNWTANLRELGGSNLTKFREEVHPALRRSCGTSGCHDTSRGGLEAGADVERSLRTILEHVRPGDPERSRLLQAPLGIRHGGYADRLPRSRGHAGGRVVFADPEASADFQAIKRWIQTAAEGPGIRVSNERSKPKVLALSHNGRLLFVGNTGSQDVSVVDTRAVREVGSIYVGNVVNDLTTYRSPTGRELLLVTTLGAGFGVPRERDPFGGETWDSKSAAANFTLRRDPATGLVLPPWEQEILGPFDAVDGTASTGFRDIQNDLVVVDLAALQIPDTTASTAPARLLNTARYEAHPAWVRYTSDTAESTNGDVKGDIPPDLMRVVGAFPEKMALVGDRLFVTMQASNEVQELRIRATPVEASDVLEPIRSYATGMQPIGIGAGVAGSASDGKLFVANFMGGTLSVIDTATGASREVILDDSIRTRPFPATDAERGEVFAHGSLFTADGDQSCFHCHYFDTGDGRPWGLMQVSGQQFPFTGVGMGEGAAGGTMGTPQQRSLLHAQPFFWEGVLGAFEPRGMILEHNPFEDFDGPLPASDLSWIHAHKFLPNIDGRPSTRAGLESRYPFRTESFVPGVDGPSNRTGTQEERRNAAFRETSMRLFGKAFAARDFMRFLGTWQVGEPHLLPNPFDRDSPAAQRGRALFEDPQVGCASCHPAPHFTRKDFPDNPTQTLAPMVALTARDGSATMFGSNRFDTLDRRRRDIEPADAGRFEEREGRYTTPQLRGLWDRPPVFLHGGRARSVREVLCPPGHPALGSFRYEPLLGGEGERPGRREVGQNETAIFLRSSRTLRHLASSEARMGTDTHGGTSHLTWQQLDDLATYLETIE